jgi:hypothetical protein
MKKIKCCEYGPRSHFLNILFSSELMNGPKKLVLYYTGKERLAGDKHSSLLGPFVSFEETEVL